MLHVIFKTTVSLHISNARCRRRVLTMSATRHGALSAIRLSLPSASVTSFIYF